MRGKRAKALKRAFVEVTGRAAIAAQRCEAFTGSRSLGAYTIPSFRGSERRRLLKLSRESADRLMAAGRAK
jgi:hypothetical protein